VARGLGHHCPRVRPASGATHPNPNSPRGSCSRGAASVGVLSHGRGPLNCGRPGLLIQLDICPFIGTTETVRRLQLRRVRPKGLPTRASRGVFPAGESECSREFLPVVPFRPVRSERFQERSHLADRFPLILRARRTTMAGGDEGTLSMFRTDLKMTAATEPRLAPPESLMGVALQASGGCEPPVSIVFDSRFNQGNQAKKKKPGTDVARLAWKTAIFLGWHAQRLSDGRGNVLKSAHHAPRRIWACHPHASLR